jgi:hypothetical protein
MVLEEQVTDSSETELPPRSQDTESGMKWGSNERER